MERRLAVAPHPADFTQVCTTELALTGKLKDEFARRNVKAIVLSVDPVDSHEKWIADINRTQNTVVNFPVIAVANRKVSELYDLIRFGRPGCPLRPTKLYLLAEPTAL